MYLLFPGRHSITTAFQEKYLWEVLRLPVSKLDIIGDTALQAEQTITTIIFAVTSANQDNSRYNPVSFHERVIGIDRFAKPYKSTLSVAYQIIGIPEYRPTHRFAEHTLKEIEYQTEGLLQLDPKNTLVLTSTPNLLALYQNLGFRILSAEYDQKTDTYKDDRPFELLKKIVDRGSDWLHSGVYAKLSKATRETWQDFPHVPAKIIRLWKDPLLTDDGSLTKNRNYASYAYGMGHGPLLEQKYKDIREPIVSGKIVDEGCADGALLSRLAKYFPDSDFIGIDIASEFIARCKERQRAGEFGEAYVHFHQRNLMDKIFEDNSIATTICNSTTHELWSYGEQEKTLKEYLRKKFDQARPGGRLVIRDVVGPEHYDDEVYMLLSETDGKNDDPLKECSDPLSLREHLGLLSTYSRFLRFAKEYLQEMRESGRRGEETKVIFSEKVIQGERYIVTRLKHAVEFMTKKDYIDNWASELNEEFCFWGFEAWQEALCSAGFEIGRPDNGVPMSRVYTNPWIVEHRFKGKVTLYKLKDGILVPLEYPVTNMVLVGEKSKNLPTI